MDCRTTLPRFVVAAAAALALGAAQADLVTNGGFETTDFTGWTQFGNTGSTGVDGTFDGVPPHSGSSQAFFGPVGSAGGIFQTLVTTPGSTYLIEFWLHNFDGNLNSFEFNWDGGAAEVSLTDAAAFPYTNFSFDLVATGAATDLRFTFRQNPSFWLLDDVSVVPEPASLALLGVALLAAVGASRRRRC